MRLRPLILVRCTSAHMFTLLLAALMLCGSWRTIATADTLSWVQAPSPNPRVLGVESNGTATYGCEAFIGGMWLVGRTWDQQTCHIGSDHRDYHIVGNFKVLSGHAGTLKTMHHGGWFNNAVKSDGFVAPCVAIRATGELVPGYIVVENPKPDHGQENCEYEYNYANTHESHYMLLEAPGQADVHLTTDTHVEGCTDFFCSSFDALGTWIAADPVRAIRLVVAVSAVVVACADLGGTLGASGGPVGAVAGGVGGAVTCVAKFPKG